MCFATFGWIACKDIKGVFSSIRVAPEERDGKEFFVCGKIMTRQQFFKKQGFGVFKRLSNKHFHSGSLLS